LTRHYRPCFRLRIGVVGGVWVERKSRFNAPLIRQVPLQLCQRYRDSNSAISASAPGTTCTKRIRLLAVAAP